MLRGHFLSADLGISGGNFLIAETGSGVIVTNEGNGRMVTTLPRVHVCITGIEKVLPTLEDFSTLLRLLTLSATGQTISIYNWSSGSWSALASRKVGTTQVRIADIAVGGTPSSYIGPSGELRVSVRCTTTGGTFVAAGNQLQISYQK